MDAFPNWINHASQSRPTDIALYSPRKSGQKLRASCDGCYAAKLKCSKERPTCPRCRDLGLVCHYSPSQRTGKPLNRRGRAPTQPLPLSHAYSTPQTSQSPAWTWTGVPFNTQPTTSSQPWTQSIAKTSMPAPDVLPRGPSNPSFLDRQTSAGTSTSLGEDLLAQWPGHLPTPAEDGSMYDEISDNFMNIADDATPARSIEDQELMPSISLCNSIDSRGCKCFPSIVQALHTMQIQPQNTHMNSLDTTLNDSRNLISQSESMLNCSCSEDGALIMLLAGLIAKHISSFAPLGSDPVPSSFPSSSSSSTHTPALSDNTSTSSTSRVTIGTYIMNSEDEERLRIEIVLIELQKLNTLLLKFRRKFSSLSISAGEMQTYETMFNFLYARLREAQTRLEGQKQKMRGDS